MGGARFYRGAWNQLKSGNSNMDTLVALGSLAAYGYSAWSVATGAREHYFDTAAVIVTLILLGKTLEAKARAGQMYKGMDPETKQPMWREPETAAEKMQARQVFYSITQAAEDEFFRFDPKKWRKSGRVAST